MKAKLCDICNSKMIRNGKTSSGRQRWRCTKCRSNSVHKNDVKPRNLEMFVRWLLSRERQKDMPGDGRTFRRKTEEFWELWPFSRMVDEVHRVIYVDGIWIARERVILIACDEKHTVGWILARYESKAAWEKLLAKIAPPDMVVCDGSPGFKSACSRLWPRTKIQRCLFHVYAQIKRYLTSHPRTLPGIELLKLSKRLLYIQTLHEAEVWIEDYFHWLEFWNDFLEEYTFIDGKYRPTHERLRKAQKALSTLISSNMMFTYLDPTLYDGMPRPKTNNVIEGMVNAQIREMLRLHRGLSTTRRIKAAFWWCYMNAEYPDSFPNILKNMATDKDVLALLNTHYAHDNTFNIGPNELDVGLLWDELHTHIDFEYGY